MAADRVSQVTLDDERRQIINGPIEVGPGWSFARQATGFIDALVGLSKPLTSGKDGAADMALMENIWRHVAS